MYSNSLRGEVVFACSYLLEFGSTRISDATKY